jgi:hypothetical protein
MCSPTQSDSLPRTLQVKFFQKEGTWASKQPNVPLRKGVGGELGLQNNQTFLYERGGGNLGFKTTKSSSTKGGGGGGGGGFFCFFFNPQK